MLTGVSFPSILISSASCLTETSSLIPVLIAAFDFGVLIGVHIAFFFFEFQGSSNRILGPECVLEWERGVAE
jgi:hypothetical protein